MKRRIEILCLVLLALLTAGCNRAPIESDKMEDILFDIYRTDACITVEYRSMSAEDKVKLYDSIFQKYGVTKEEFDEALDWYAHHTKEWQLIHENLEARTDEYVTKVENYEFSPKTGPASQDSIDTIDIWVPKSEWQWRSGDGEIDRNQTDYTWDDREYFSGMCNLKYEMRMRCWGDTTQSVTTMMVLKYSKGADDTLRYVAPVDSVERIYRLNKMTRGKDVSLVRVMVMDTVEGLRGVNVKGACLKYSFNNKDQSVSDRVKNNLWLLRREVRMGVSVRR